VLGRRGEFSQLTSSLTIRIPEDMRKRLESEAATKDESVAQVLLWHLRRSFNRDREVERDPAIRAFCFLFAELSDRLRWGAGPPPAIWERNPFVFRAFRIAVEKLLGSFEPKGKMKRPPFESFLKVTEEYSNRGILTPSMVKEMAKVWGSPERAADNAVRMTLFDLAGWKSPQAIARYWNNRTRHDENLRDISSRHIKDAERTWYGMADVRRDLQIKVHIDTNKDRAKSKGRKGND
jgi:hypothetical protein